LRTKQIVAFPIELGTIGDKPMSNFVVLLVEDDPVQRGFVADMLRDESFEVIECATAEAAEFVVTSTGNELRALITDNNLAGNMSGRELAGFAKRRFPNLNVVITSGNPVKPVPYRTTFLRKPFLPSRLLEAIKT
jgi:DNA-binding NtrC family response regulator